MARKPYKQTKRSSRPVKTKPKAPKASLAKASRAKKDKKGSATSVSQNQTKVYKKLPNAFRLTKMSWQFLWDHKRFFIGLTIVYGILNLILVKGLSSSTDVSSLKSQLDQVTTGNLGSIFSGLSIFAVLIGSAGNGSSQTAGAYQLFLALITSLAIIWSLRELMVGVKIRIRDAYYLGMAPLIPFILVLIVIGIQLLPLLIGAVLYSTVISGGIAVNLVEKLIWLAIFIILALISLYFISSSLFALYIVTLPEMTPIKSLRSARQLVKHRRLSVMRKILSLPIILLVVAAIIMLPIIIWLTVLAQWVFFLLTMFGLVALHAYMYTLYRELLNE